ncbi:MAG: FAD-dependent oxidoreductase [Bacillota bacterium]|nr:FAD-dependent oxidoreductase [Bacillota bacterium]
MSEVRANVTPLAEPPADGGSGGTPLGSVLVVGAGIAGMQAALDLASSGFLVHLVTSEPSIGGRMAQLDKTFPTNDCAMCLLGPKMTDCQNHPNIVLHTMSTVVGLEGKAGDFRALVEERARYVDVRQCTGCGDCAGVCPVTVKDRFNLGLSERKAIYKHFPQAVPNAYAIEKRGTPPCRATCPAGCNVQGYVALISQGKFREALEVVRRRQPFASICGRACHHPCESECNRGQYDEPLSIAVLKRAAADYGWSDEPQLPATWREERVAVVGAGPAGLAAALDLAREGYRVTVFDAAPAPGGMLRSAIPEYRLPLGLVEKETGWILSHGMEFRGGMRLGSDFSLGDLASQGFRAVILALGTPRGRGLAIPGADGPGVELALPFLNRAKLGPRPHLEGRVLVIGGGNVAIDAARCALRLGATSVAVACLESRPEMPAHPWEIEEAEEEGIQIHTSWGPVEVVREGGRVRGVRLRRCTRVFDDQGRFRPEFDDSITTYLEADQVIIAIGQAPDAGFLPAQGVELDGRGFVAADPVTRATSRPGVFACGDGAGGKPSIVDAVADGHEAAESVRRFLQGLDLAEGRPARVTAAAAGAPGTAAEKLGPPEGVLVEVRPRLRQRLAPAAERVRDFREVYLGYTPEEAQEEASRCLNCGICSECLQCVAACKKQAVNHNDQTRTVEIPVGAVILAPGMGLFEAEGALEYGWSIYPNVVTSMEFERYLSATGPTGGKVVRPSDGKRPRRVAFIQCVGSRDTTCAEYCSAVCCMYTAKEAIIAREHDPDIEPTVFYLDLRAYGKGFDRYIDQARAHGVRYVRSMISTVKEDPVTRNLIIRYWSGERLEQEEFDLVVLAVGARPPAGAAELAKAAGVELDGYGFARTDPVFSALSTRPGVFLAGAFAGPRDIPESLVGASAAAACAHALLAPGRGTQVTPKTYPPERDVRGEEPRVGVFVCRCGINIGGVVDVPAVVEFASTLPGVAHAQEFTYTCSQDSLQRIREAIAEKGLNRVVVASCSLRTHQSLFRETLREAGLNQFLFEMANIRDQCSWVHRDVPDAATEKAKDLVAMAVAKARTLAPLPMQAVPVVQKALIVGGGPAGMAAALALSAQGFPCYLVERSDRLGGQMLRLRRTITGQDVPVLLADLAGRVMEDANVTVFTGAEVAEVSGHQGHFTTRLRLPDGEVTVEHGVILVATGVEEYRPTQYLYGQDERVCTVTELEGQLAALEREGSRPPWKQVVFILCVGSRDGERPYCSRVCCAQSLKNALWLKRLAPDCHVVVLYRDMRSYGFLEKYYREARSLGISFLPYPDQTPPVLRQAEGQLWLGTVDAASGRGIELHPDLVALATAVVPAAGAKELASLLKVPLGEGGFFLETHIKMGPLDFPSAGIYLCGGAHWPKSLEEAISQAQGAASRAAVVLSKESLWVGGVVSVVDEARCAGCLTCVRVCPYHVPFINARGVAQIEAVQCQGCGMCAAECPARAIQLGNYRFDQMEAKLAGLP